MTARTLWSFIVLVDYVAAIYFNNLSSSIAAFLAFHEDQYDAPMIVPTAISH